MIRQMTFVVIGALLRDNGDQNHHKIILQFRLFKFACTHISVSLYDIEFLNVNQ